MLRQKIAQKQKSRESLQSVFNSYNNLYFRGKLKISSVRFVKSNRSWHGQTAFFSDCLPIIEINARLRDHGRLVRIVLLHEMCHVENTKEVSHGPRFQKQIKRLQNLGAYDNLL